MKSFIVLALCVAVAVAAPPSNGNPEALAEVLEQRSDNIGVDGYNTAYKTSNGIEQQESGKLEGVGTEDEGIEVRGQFSYPGPDGVLYTVTYTAGRLGFQPQGAHLPVPPQA